ncbi:branched chain amino acid aminotransferase [Rhodospirillum rubrum]|uniref:branched-chain amino acid aminotransferase n=1 Tax=Rhodospirillum rubrum TaxID=1085 RepID=UPI001907F635|nr:branched-chain amino acid aminotransferase [Rhodospirillum rubrum]MBK1664912.1 branched chain amino acid aminotransferase [Rhodospirillum rubrum]MBK1676840.1 branched chain amino acid aminotransferase [Rhodospirillum rubrum]
MAAHHGAQAQRRSLVYGQGDWREGNPALIGPATHGLWMASTVFDGARYFEGVAPDLLAHCERVIHSARLMGLEPCLTGAEIADFAWEGISRFKDHYEDAGDLYICPMIYGETGFIMPDADSAQFVLCLWETPMPEPVGFSACLTPFRRPARDMAPTEAKASCLYPNVGRAVRAAKERGFETAVMLDPAGNVAEFSYTNLFFAKGSQVITPAPNGTFLNGLTRQRIIRLLRDDGVDVVERAVDFAEVLEADEVFATGNYFKVGTCVKVEDRTFEPGPYYRKARALYWEFARTTNQ